MLARVGYRTVSKGMVRESVAKRLTVEAQVPETGLAYSDDFALEHFAKHESYQPANCK
jgi:hypothetical protein